MISDLLTTPCTITLRSLAPTTEDDYGNEIASDPEVLETVCHVQQQQRSEEGGEGELSRTVWVAFFPAGTTFDTADVITVEGHGDFEVTGDPWPVDDPRDGVHHIEATLVRTGAAVGS